MKCYECNKYGYYASKCCSEKKGEKAHLADVKEKEESALLMAIMEESDELLLQ